MSLDAMAAGGMYDQVGGGFHRYSVDAYWLVPHFEKMLYDQALLATRVPARLAGHRRAAVPARRRGDDRLRAARPPPRRRRLLLGRGRRLRGRRGQVLPAGRSTSSRRCAATTADEVIRYFGVTDGGNFEDPHTGFRGNILHVVDRADDRARLPWHGSLPALLGTAREPGAPGTRRQGAARLERAVPAMRSPRPPSRSIVTTGWKRRAPTRASSLARAPARRRAAAAVVAGRAGAPPRVRARTTPRCSRRCSRSPSSTTSRGSPKRARSPTSSSGCSPTTSTAGSSPPAPTPRRSSCGPRTRRTTPRRRRTRSPPTGCCGSPRSPATTTPRRAASGGSATLAPVLGEHPTAFAYLLAAVERVVTTADRGRGRRAT